MQDILFKKKMTPVNIPLAEKCRPQKLEELVGQNELLGKDSVLKKMIISNNISSFIMWGPPGTGKTTIANIIDKNNRDNFVKFSAVLSSIKEVKEVMRHAESILNIYDRPTIIFIDEIHRFNKAQQDSFLHYVENGSIILIGATTENPSFEIIPALLSRCQVVILEKLETADIVKIITNALKKTQSELELTTDIMYYIADQSGGDARRALNYVDILDKYSEEKKDFTVDFVSKIIKKKHMFYDKNAEEHYNLISALHKSLRGSDPQAGLYWLARMLESGEDPMYIARRLVRFASEDVGLSDPQALVQAIAVKDAVHFLGMPESNNALAQLVVYLACSPKSNSLYKAYKKASEDARNTDNLGVPFHIRNAPTKLMKDLGYGKNYKYSHEFDFNYSYQKYFPETMSEKEYYVPSKYGFEKELKKRIDFWEKLKIIQLKKNQSDKN